MDDSYKRRQLLVNRIHLIDLLFARVDQLNEQEHTGSMIPGFLLRRLSPERREQAWAVFRSWRGHGLL
jgi:hypothetical protein